MGSGVARIECRHRERRPVGIAGRVRVAVAVGSLDRGDGTPAVVGVLRVVERDHAVGQAGTEQSEHAGVLADPSFARAARMALAAFSPTRIPWRTCPPPPIWVSESWNFASTTVCWFGKSDSRTVCAADAAAASGDALRGACETTYGACRPLIAFTAS